MNYRHILGTLCIALALGSGACGNESAEHRQPERSAAAAGAADTVSRSMLRRLEEHYAVLRSNRAPQPHPDGEGGDVGPLESTLGEATFYADEFDGRRTASGIPFRQNQLVAAHRDYPFGTILHVTNLRNGNAVNVRVVDRGPYGAIARFRHTVLDLSRRAAERLGFIETGRTKVRVEVLQWGRGLPAS